MKHPASLTHAEKPARNGIAEPAHGELARLGCAVSVRFRGPTETGPARFLARIDDGREKVSASVPYSYSDRDADEIAAVEKCLARWLLTFSPDCRPSGFRIHSKGFTGSETLFFFSLIHTR